MSSRLIQSTEATEMEEGDASFCLTKCVVPDCGRWAFACKDNRPFRELQGECYCKYHFLTEIYFALYEMTKGLLIAVGDADSVRQQIADRQKATNEMHFIAREIRDFMKIDDIPQAELASFKAVFGDLWDYGHRQAY